MVGLTYFLRFKILNFDFFIRIMNIFGEIKNDFFLDFLGITTKMDCHILKYIM